MNEKKRMILLLLIVFVIVAASVAAIFVMKSGDKANKLYAEIYRDDELLATIDLNQVEESYTLRFDYESEDGQSHYNLVLVEKGRIGVREADCPDKVCVNMGMISDSLLPVTCLPNHLMIRIVSDGSDTNFDGLLY